MAYNPSLAKDPTQAQSLAVAFRDNTAKKSLNEIGKDPANRAAIKAFQGAAGLVADGIVGPKTREAYNYWLGIPVTKATATKEQAVAQNKGTFQPHPEDKTTVQVVGPIVAPPQPPIIPSAAPSPAIKQGPVSAPTPAPRGTEAFRAAVQNVGKPAQPSVNKPVVIPPKKPSFLASMNTGEKLAGAALIAGIGLKIFGGKKKHP